MPTDRVHKLQTALELLRQVGHDDLKYDAFQGDVAVPRDDYRRVIYTIETWLGNFAKRARVAASTRS